MDAATAAEHAARIAADGYTIVPDAIEADLVDALHDDLLRLERELGIVPADNAFEGSKTVRIYNLLVHGELYERIPVHDSVLPVVERVLDHGCLVSSLSSIAIGPEETAQPIHADDQLIPIAKPHVPTVCNSMWAITDFTEANGATRIIPGSHRWDPHRRLTPSDEADVVQAEMRAGSVLFYTGSVWHGGGANHTDKPRLGVILEYVSSWLRPQENHVLAVPREVVATLPERLQELLGYNIHPPFMGYVDGRHPRRVLRESAP